MNFIKYVFFGIVMGIANVIPGVSGGTMAIVLNFYDLLMESITLNLRIIKKNLYFIVPLAIGLVVSVVGVSKIMKYLFNFFPTQTFSGFIGIVLASLPLIFAKAKSNKKIDNVSWFAFAITLLIMIVLSFYSVSKEGATIKYTSLNLESFIYCVLAMTIATATMIIPGISGSLMLLIMGMYGTVYTVAIGSFNIPLLIPCTLGGVIGLFGGAKLITVLFKKFEQLTYMGIAGLLVGSLIELYKNSNIFSTDLITIMTSFLSLIIMFFIVLFFSLKEIKKEGK